MKEKKENGVDRTEKRWNLRKRVEMENRKVVKKCDELKGKNEGLYSQGLGLRKM